MFVVKVTIERMNRAYMGGPKVTEVEGEVHINDREDAHKHLEDLLIAIGVSEGQ